MRYLLVALLVLVPSLVRAETIQSFLSDITLAKDGSFEVVETIVYDFETEEKHGIYRFIPIEHPEVSKSLFKDRLIDVDLKYVQMDGGAVPYEVTDDRSEFYIKIGDPDTTISGSHTYQIAYTVKGALFYRDSGEAELYWNVTGDEWSVPMMYVEARVFDPEDITLSAAKCYYGYSGENDECTVEDSGDFVRFGQIELMPNEGMTVVKAIDPKLVEKQVIERWSLWILWLIGAPFWFIGIFVYVYLYKRRNRTKAAIIAQYEPYQGIDPMYLGMVQDGRVDPKDITAGIVDLARRGFLKIKHTERKVLFFISAEDYEITMLRPYDELESENDKSVFSMLFGHGKGEVVGTTVSLNDVTKGESERRVNYGLFSKIQKNLQEQLLSDGLVEHNWKKVFSTIFVNGTLLVSLLVITALFGADIFIPVVIALFLFVFGSLTLMFTYSRLSRKGYEARDYLQGFKMFLSVTDEERFKFHNAPQKSPEQFMAFLPYAIAFGVEKEWAEVFKDIALPTPDWYDGQGTSFNPTGLATSFALVGKSARPETSSASSGGGSSGGGSGGGGGGSW